MIGRSRRAAAVLWVAGLVTALALIVPETPGRASPAPAPQAKGKIGRPSTVIDHNNTFTLELTGTDLPDTIGKDTMSLVLNGYNGSYVYVVSSNVIANRVWRIKAKVTNFGTVVTKAKAATPEPPKDRNPKDGEATLSVSSSLLDGGVDVPVVVFSN